MEGVYLLKNRIRQTCIIALLSASLIASILPPVKASAVVTPQTTMTYEILSKNIVQLANQYPDLIEYHSIGKTVFGRHIWAVKLGHGEATLFINGSHHAREWLTSTLNMQMIEQYAKAYQTGTTFEGYDVRKVLNETSVWFVPMVNPDGVTLQQFGLKAFPQAFWKSLIAMNDGSKNFARWKANAQGVDLNRQYPASWPSIVNNLARPHWANHKGVKPLQTIENQKLVGFTKRINPEIAVSYHSAGRILYWNFHTKAANLSRDKRLANIFTAITGYSQVRPTSNPSGGGYTDWFISQWGRPAFTPEIGLKNGETSLPLSVFGEEWRRNKKIGIWLADESYRLWLKKNSARKAVLQEDKIVLSSSTDVYYNPNFLSTRSGVVEPQVLTTVAKLGNWFKVRTPSQGDKWIYASDPVLLGDPIQVDQILNLNEQTAYYKEAYDLSSKQGVLEAGDVQASLKWGDWYQVTTPNGEFWIQMKK